MEAVKVMSLMTIASFYTFNMGASGISVSFSPAYGGRIVSRYKAVALFTVSVLLGAILVGGRVSETIRARIIPQNHMTLDTAVTILLGCCISLFMSNILRIPQSTSIVTVFSLIGAGIYFRALNVGVITILFLTWGAGMITVYFITYLIVRKLYPPNVNNLWIYEKVHAHERKLKLFVLLVGMYSAFSIGTNNVANVVGPVSGANLMDTRTALLVFAPFFGVGSLIFGRRILDAVGREIVPLGLLTATVISLVVSSFLVLSSFLGLPAPYAQFMTASILAVNAVKREINHSEALRHPTTSRIVRTWLLTPIVSLSITYLLLFLTKGV